MDKDVHISGVDASSWVIQARAVGYKFPGWVVGMRVGNIIAVKYTVMDDFGYLREVETPCLA